ncbi:MAG TPA: DUF4159 domain-containing protein [Candidatus Kapabacteria bacterium]|nr:DUF4159 domain-containing protein [Candidatus Kapabacteria bacterium]
MKKLVFLIFLISILIEPLQSESNSSLITLARLKYSGGGDWYNDPSGEVNLLNYVRKNTNLNVNPVYEYVDLNTDKVFDYPILFLTGHGSISFTDSEVRRLRAYLENGGFLYVDDDYGLDEYIRREMKKVFPDQEFTELPYNHGLFKAHFQFPNGVPKIHEHNNKPPQTFGLFYNGRLCVVYTYESNPSDGWVESSIHNNPPEKREKALQFGTNLIVWALNN